MVAKRLGSPRISVLVVGVEEKGLERVMENSPEGGGATARGIFLGVGWKGGCVDWGVGMEWVEGLGSSVMGKVL